jgi:hypothetical protein
MNVLNRISSPVKKLTVYKIRNVSTGAIKKSGGGGNASIYVA